jgi:two-component system, sensor histidine kinase and response regulator
VGAAGGAWIGVRRAPRGARLAALLIAAGITASATGDLSYRVYQWTGTTPDISLADIPWFSSCLGLGAALFITLVRGRGPLRVNIDAVLALRWSGDLLVRLRGGGLQPGPRR